MPSDSRHSRSRSLEDDRYNLPKGIEPISESDYFLKSAEFRTWLKDEKHKYFDELSGDKARSYFRKFVKAWNKGKLSNTLYRGIDPSSQAANSLTAYKWSFASNRSRVNGEALKAARDAVGIATYGNDVPYIAGSTKDSGGGRVLGPTLPSSSDLLLARESASENRIAERDYKRKRERAEDKDRLEDIAGPKEVGREGMLEKKRVKREGDRAFREKGDDGFEVDESTLLGGGDSFREQIARRDAARKRFEEKRMAAREDKVATSRDRVSNIKEKDKATMDMFQQMAKERFG